jgi:RNA recognition motif-containing protein
METTEQQDQRARPAPTPDDEESVKAIAEGRRLYVGNLPYRAKPSDVTSYFDSAGYPTTRISMSVDPFTGRNPSYCFLEFEDKETAQNAMQALEGKIVLGRPLKIRNAYPGRTRGPADGHQGIWAPTVIHPGGHRQDRPMTGAL